MFLPQSAEGKHIGWPFSTAFLAFIHIVGMAAVTTFASDLPTPQGRPVENLKVLSCVICRRRKLKCDRRDPCSRCVKSSVECIYSDPVRSRHQRKPELVLITRLKHYENLLRKNGIDPNTIDSDNFDDSASIEGEAENTLNTDSLQGSSDIHNQATKGQFLSRGGRSIYFDKYGFLLLTF